MYVLMLSRLQLGFPIHQFNAFPNFVYEIEIPDFFVYFLLSTIFLNFDLPTAEINPLLRLLLKPVRLMYIQIKIQSIIACILYRVPNNDRPLSPDQTKHGGIEMKIPTSSMYSSTSLLKSSVVNVSSNDITNNLKKRVQRKKMTQHPPIICKLSVNFLMPQSAKLNQVKLSCIRL